nr:transposase [Arenimonas donghaensis]
MAAAIASPSQWTGSELMAWVLMPDHWHGLLVLGTESRLGQTLQRAKGSSARLFNKRLGRRGSVWGAGFHDRALRSHENLRAAARYLVANPLRAGLVERVGDYPFWDATWLEGDCPI